MKVKEIKFTVNAKGRKMAHYYSVKSLRWFPMKLSEAELLAATGSVKVYVGR